MTRRLPALLVGASLLLGASFAPAAARASGAKASSPAPARATAKPAKAGDAKAGKLTLPRGPAPHRPLTLAAQKIEGKSDAPRVLFVHTGPKIALEDAPKHPSYLRDDFTAALSSPITVRVRNVEPLRPATLPGGNR